MVGAISTDSLRGLGTFIGDEGAGKCGVDGETGHVVFFRPIRIHILAQIVAEEGTPPNFRESRLVKYYILGRSGIFTY